MNNKIQSIQKQNDSIYASLIAKNIHFDRLTFSENSTDEEIISILSEENNKLKEFVKANKPPPIPKKEEIKEEIKEKIKEKIKEIKKEEDDKEEIFDDPIKKFDTITNMEDIKRAFFNGLYDSFNEQIKNYQFKFYIADYKYNSDKDGAPDFSAKNLLKGFVRNFDDYRKYFIICFRCYKLDNNKFEYKSYWIVNTNEPVSNIIGSIADDFNFVESNNINEFLNIIKKIENIDETNCIGESYVH